MPKEISVIATEPIPPELATGVAALKEAHERRNLPGYPTPGKLRLMNELVFEVMQEADGLSA